MTDEPYSLQGSRAEGSVNTQGVPHAPLEAYAATGQLVEFSSEWCVHTSRPTAKVSQLFSFV